MGDLIRIGYDVKNGDAEYLDPRAADCWFAAVDLIKARLGIDLSKRILQALGSAEESAGVHEAPGVCVDIRLWGLTNAQILAVVALLRECGFAATWYRDWEGNEHIHAACGIGVWTPALYQVTAVKLGYDGLGSGGKQGKDPHPKPSAWRTAQTGAAWAREQLEDDMALSDADKTWITKQLKSITQLKPINEPGRTDEWGTTIGDSIARTAFRTNLILPLVQQIAVKSGVDVDEAAIASAVVAGIAPQLVAAIVAKLDGIAGVDPAALAAEIVAELGSKLVA